jgi:hypothetical protein
MCVKTKLNITAKSRSISGWPLDLKEPVGFYIDSPYKAVYISVSIFEYNTIRLLYWAYVPMGLYPNTPQWYQYYRPQ